MNWQPTSGPNAARQRAAMLSRLREYFDGESVLEVDTPALNKAAVSDIHIESLEVTSSLTNRRLYLHTSPEFCMKRMLASGYPDIFTICRVFRDAEVGRSHQLEFTMLEWYRLGFDLRGIITDTTTAIGVALDDPKLATEPVVMDYAEAFQKACGVDPATASIAELANVVDADYELRQSLGTERDDWLDLLLTTQVAPGFAPDRLTVLKHYPASQAALARLCPRDPGLADRFEVFMGTLELANGYVELTDAQMQADRIAEDQAARDRRGLLRRPIDQAFLAALNSGLPACAGVAVGVERLHMLYRETDDIRNVVPFVFED